MSFSMIGRILDFGSKSTELGTQHCLLKCHRRAVPLCQTQQMESNHLEDICPLRRAKKDHSNRLFPSTQLLRTITRSSGIWSLIVVTSILLLLCRSFLTKQSAETGVTIQSSIPDNEVPVSVMAQDLLTTYKYGWKTSYYQNTYDFKTDEVEDTKESLESLVAQLENAEEEECESCKI